MALIIIFASDDMLFDEIERYLDILKKMCVGRHEKMLFRPSFAYICSLVVCFKGTLRDTRIL